MTRNIVICSDGTGNTFDKSVSNVTRLVRLLAHDDHQTQVTVYDQGIGTNVKRLASVRAYADSIPDKEALVVLDGPGNSWFSPTGLSMRVFGLLAGWGLTENVRQMYCRLSQLYRSPEDRVFLFGFSRGAFTVRALAGLIYRCRLPRPDIANVAECFTDAWALYQPHVVDDEAVTAFRARHGERECPIHFLGVWDTVKSYGGVRPISLPHLRHNPIVGTVRHALALDEQRSWFNATTWGQLDLDEEGARKRLRVEDRPKYKDQKIQEVWFRGCHSDVGGGDGEEQTARIALRWMLAEGETAGLRINDEGRQVLLADDPDAPPEVHESDSRLWRLVDLIPRQEIDNSGEWPVKTWKVGRTGIRRPDALRRGGEVFLHRTVGPQHAIPEPVRYLKTTRHPSGASEARNAGRANQRKTRREHRAC
jgi:uncharacterized protein (DUF2235 family)